MACSLPCSVLGRIPSMTFRICEVMSGSDLGSDATRKDEFHLAILGTKARSGIFQRDRSREEAMRRGTTTTRSRFARTGRPPSRSWRCLLRCMGCASSSWPTRAGWTHSCQQEERTPHRRMKRTGRRNDRNLARMERKESAGQKKTRRRKREGASGGAERELGSTARCCTGTSRPRTSFSGLRVWVSSQRV